CNKGKQSGQIRWSVRGVGELIKILVEVGPGADIGLVLGALVGEAEIEIIGDIVGDGGAGVFIVLATDVVPAGGVLDVAVTLQLGGPEFHPAVLRHGQVQQAANILTTEVPQRALDFAAEFPGRQGTKNGERATDGVLAEQGPLRTAQHLQPFEIEVLQNLAGV